MTQTERQPDERGRPGLFLLMLAGLWLSLAVAETVHRYGPFIHPPGRNPSGEPAPYHPLVHERRTGDAGGDLTRMLGFRAGAGLFGVPRADIDVRTDPPSSGRFSACPGPVPAVRSGQPDLPPAREARVVA